MDGGVVGFRIHINNGAERLFQALEGRAKHAKIPYFSSVQHEFGLALAKSPCLSSPDTSRLLRLTMIASQLGQNAISRLAI